MDIKTTKGQIIQNKDKVKKIKNKSRNKDYQTFNTRS